MRDDEKSPIFLINNWCFLLFGTWSRKYSKEELNDIAEELGKMITEMVKNRFFEGT
jgi:hypothetical protein